MSRLIVVVGLVSDKPTAHADNVYVGRSGSEAEAAMKSSVFPRFEIFRNVTSVRKNNPNAAANQANAAVQEDDLAAQLTKLREMLDTGEKLLHEQGVKITDLEKARTDALAAKAGCECDLEKAVAGLSERDTVIADLQKKLELAAQALPIPSEPPAPSAEAAAETAPAAEVVAADSPAPSEGPPTSEAAAKDGKSKKR